MSNTSPQLALHEQVLLIALREEDGKINSKANFEYQTIMAAAILAELMLHEKVTISEEPKARVELKDSSSTGNDVLDVCLAQIADSAKPRAPGDWVGRISRTKNLRDKTAENLCKKSILKSEEGKVFFFFDKTFDPELDPKPEQDLINKLRTAIFSDTQSLDERTLILLALLHKSTLLEIPFDKKELKARKSHMENLCNGNVMADAANKALKAAQMAILMTTVIIPATTTTFIVN